MTHKTNTHKIKKLPSLLHFLAAFLIYLAIFKHSGDNKSLYSRLTPSLTKISSSLSASNTQNQPSKIVEIPFVQFENASLAIKKLENASLEIKKHQKGFNFDKQKDRKSYLQSMCQTFVEPLQENVCRNDGNGNFESKTQTFINFGITSSCLNNKSSIGLNERLNEGPLSSSKGTYFASAYNWIVDLNSNFAICLPPKAACTTWQRVYLALKNDKIEYLDNKLDKSDWISYIYNKTPRLLDLARKSYRKNLINLVDSEKFDKIITSRHPFERLYSAWKDKFRLEKKPEELGHSVDKWIDTFTPIIKSYWINRLDKNRTLLKIENDGQDAKKMAVRFQEFLNYLATEPISFYDGHYIPVSVMCLPCEYMITRNTTSLKYLAKSESLPTDLIPAFKTVVKTENQNKTLENIKENLQHFQLMRGPYVRGHFKNFDFRQKSTAQEAFRKIAEKDPGLVYKIYEKFKFDFLLFGYDVEGYF